MDEISELWEELKFEVGSIGNELLPKERQEVYIGMGNRNADILFIGNDPKLYLAEDYKVEPQSSGSFLIRLLDVVEYLPETYYITTLSKREIKIKNFNEGERKKLIEKLLIEHINEFPFFINLLISVFDIKDVENNHKDELAYTKANFENQRIEIYINFKKIEKYQKRVVTCVSNKK